MGVWRSCVLVLITVLQYLIMANDDPIDCHHPVYNFNDCVNKTMRERYAAADKIRMIKLAVNECLLQNKCTGLFIDVVPTGNGPNQDSSDQVTPSNLDSHQNVFVCMRDFRNYSQPMVETCIEQVLPNAPLPWMRRYENKWTLMQESMNKTRIQNLCHQGGNAGNASVCIDQIFTPNAAAEKESQKRFQQFCNAARQCRVGMGVCRTALENGRKAWCDCKSRIFQQFDIIKGKIASCANVTKEMIKAAKRNHPLPFLSGCGADPCDPGQHAQPNSTVMSGQEEDKKENGDHREHRIL